VRRLRVGIDVGGTNTDAVALEGGQLVAWVKTPTTADVTTGIVTALDQLLENDAVTAAEIADVMVGTTHFTNAMAEVKGLLPTAVIRLCGPATRALPPMVDWPPQVYRAVNGRVFLCQGGHEYDGREIVPLDRQELKDVAAEMRTVGLRTIAISAVFSPVNGSHEQEAAAVIADEHPEAKLSISTEIGRIGLLERENATIVNACLAGVADQIVPTLEDTVRRHGIAARIHLCQNDGTLMDADYAYRYPVATFASGPTNSMRGAALLSGESDCVVVDIGGTTTDVGVLRKGFPREAAVAVAIAGVRTNFRMPDVLSLAIGGGSVVHLEPEVTVGPESVGYRLSTEARVFGGPTLTATDLAVAGGRATVGDPGLVAGLDPEVVEQGLGWIRRRIAETIDRMKTEPDPIPVVVVGGGSLLLDGVLAGASRVVRPEHFQVANAIGAALAQVGGQVDRVVSLETTLRDQAVEAAKHEAATRCIAAGADPASVRVVDVEEIPLAYLPSNAVRIVVRAIGDLRESR
jgi:N-methylhydantoinase A/oxoprolinase/acetone carboxylase beta subunit